MYYMVIGGATKSDRIDYIMNIINAIGCHRFTCYITTRSNTVVLLNMTGKLKLKQNNYEYSMTVKQQIQIHL